VVATIEAYRRVRRDVPSRHDLARQIRNQSEKSSQGTRPSHFHLQTRSSQVLPLSNLIPTFNPIRFCRFLSSSSRHLALRAPADMQISVVMDKFESQFSDLDVQTSYMESTMSDTTALTTPQDQVDTLISQVADENGLEISQKVGQGNVPASTPVPAVQEREGGLEEDGKLAERLRALRVSSISVLSL